MSIFNLTIDTHGGHFGETEAAERGVIGRLLADVAHKVGQGHTLVGDQPIVLNGDVIGAFSFGAKAHSFAKPE
jgi:hypothetical protein